MYLHSNSQAQWYHALCDLQHETDTVLPLEIEYYLTHVLINSTTQISLIDSLVGEDFLENLHQCTGKNQWPELGNKCLIITGVFPQWANHRCRSKNYVAQMGKLAYQQAALIHFGAQKKIYEHLSEHFDDLSSFLNKLDFQAHSH